MEKMVFNRKAGWGGEAGTNNGGWRSLSDVGPGSSASGVLSGL